MKLKLGSLVFAIAASALAQGQPPVGPPPGGGRGPAAPFETHMLKPNIYWVEGGGGNSTVIVGDKGVIVVDAKVSPAGGKELLDNIAKITPKPVTTVILTHSDGDHVNGLASFPAGITIIAHENNKKEQEAAIAAGGRGAPSKDHLPTQLITKNKESLKIDGQEIEVYHWAPSHTSGDLVVYLPSEGVVATGDVITQMPDPLIHPEKGGTSEGWFATAKGIVELKATIFIPGHGPIETKDDIQKSITRAEEKRNKIKDLVAQGKSLDEVRAALGEQPPAPGGRGPAYTEVIYRELTAKKG